MEVEVPQFQSGSTFSHHLMAKFSRFGFVDLLLKYIVAIDCLC